MSEFVVADPTTPGALRLLRPFVDEPADLPLDPEDWRKQEHLWWVEDRSRTRGLLARVEWREWTFAPSEPPRTVGMVSNGYRWRHPTFEEACERQRRFNQMTRDRWANMVTGSHTNLRRRLAPTRGRTLVFTSGGRESEAQARLAARGDGSGGPAVD